MCHTLIASTARKQVRNNPQPGRNLGLGIWGGVPRKLLKRMARLEGFEPPTYRFEVCRSIHLSYRRVFQNLSAKLLIWQFGLRLGSVWVRESFDLNSADAVPTVPWPAASPLVALHLD